MDNEFLNPFFEVRSTTVRSISVVPTVLNNKQEEDDL
jgi:hypothetical protein